MGGRVGWIGGHIGSAKDFRHQHAGNMLVSAMRNARVGGQTQHKAPTRMVFDGRLM